MLPCNETNAMHHSFEHTCIHARENNGTCTYSTDKNHMHIGRVFPEVERVKCTRFALAAPSGRTNESRGDNARSTREYAFFSGRGFVLLIVLLESLLFSLSGFTLETFNRKLNEHNIYRLRKR